MKLWILKAREDLPKRNDPWNTWHDTACGFVIRAETEADARGLAATSGDTGNEGPSAWTDPTFSTCEELTADGPAGVALCDYKDV